MSVTQITKEKEESSKSAMDKGQRAPGWVSKPLRKEKLRVWPRNKTSSYLD